MPAKKKRTDSSETDVKVYEVTYMPQGMMSHMGGAALTTNKNIKSSGWQIQDGMVTFYGSGPVFVIPERLLVSIERLS
jgi:hypothetical protein